MYGWSLIDGKCLQKLSDSLPSPSAVVELVRCGCGISNCSKICSCKQNNLPCTEIWNCEAGVDCENRDLSGEMVDEGNSNSDNELN